MAEPDTSQPRPPDPSTSVEESVKGGPKSATKKPPGEITADEPRLRLTLGRDLVALLFTVVIASVALALLFFRTSGEVVAVIAPVTTMVGTLVGTIFGVQASAQGGAAQAQASQQTTAQAVGLAVQAATLLPPDKQAEMLDALHRTGNSTSNGNPSIEVF